MTNDNPASNTEGQQNDRAAEVRRLRRLLKDIAELAQHASLTGSLQGGARTAARRYNQVVLRLEQLGLASPGLFSTLPGDEVSFDEIGVEATLLAGYLKEDEAPASGPGHTAPIINISGDLHGPLGGIEGLNDLKDLGRVIRESLPEWLRSHAPPAPPTPPTPPTPPEPPTPAASGFAFHANTSGANPNPAPDPRPQPMPDLNAANR
jgi:hypothetical protein